MAFSPKTARTRDTQKDDMFGRQRKKQEGQQRHQYEVANKYVFKCRLKVDIDRDDDGVTNDGKLFHARAAATGKARSPIVLRVPRVTGTTTAVDELERRLRLAPTSAVCKRWIKNVKLCSQYAVSNFSAYQKKQVIRSFCRLRMPLELT